MGNIKEIRDRLNSVNDTMKITNAMYLISSTKLRKAKKMLSDTEPFFYATKDMIARVVENIPEDTQNVFLESKDDISEEKIRRGYIIITDDKGLAGAFNHNVIKLAEEHLATDNGNSKLFVIGDVGRYHFDTENIGVEEYFPFSDQTPSLHRARKISAEVIDYYMEHRIDEFYIIYTTMKGSVCDTKFEKMLPLDFVKEIKEGNKEGINDGIRDEYWMDPSPSAILDNIVPNYITCFIYGALVESYCSAQNSRMLAMDTANKNAEKMTGELMRKYNSQRQAMITQEITEVVSGAKALKRSKELKDRSRAATKGNQV